MKIGALAVPRPNQAGVADGALALISGWNAKTREPLAALLEEYKAAIAQNQAVYDQAAGALRELSAKEAALKDIEAKAKDAQATATAAERRLAEETDRANREISAARAKLNIDQVAHDSNVLAWTKQATEREKALKAREDAVAKQMRDIEQRQASIDRISTDIAQREAVLASTKARLREIVNG